MAARRARTTHHAPLAAVALAAVTFAAVATGSARAQDGAAGVLSLGHRLGLRGDVAALERLLAGSAAGGVVEPAVRAHLLAELGRFDQAVEEYQRALAATPDDAQVAFGLADVELRRGNRDAAVAALTRIWKGSAVPPLKAEAVRRQLALAAEDDRWDAVDWGAALGSIDDPDLTWRLLDALVDTADREGAVFQVERAASRTLGVEPLGVGQALVLTTIALKVGDLARAAATTEELLRNERTANASIHALRGEVAFQKGQAVDAARAFAEARGVAPGWTRMLERHARAARASGDVRAAERDLRTLLAEPLDLAVRDAARADLQRLLLERAQWADAALVYLEGVSGRGPERRAVALESFVAVVPDPAKALAALSTAAVPPEQAGELDRLKGELATRAGDETAAIRSLELAHDAATADPEVLERLAQLERQAGRLDRAIAHYRTWLDREPRRAGALTGLVAALRQAGSEQHALDAGRAPTRERPDDPEAWAFSGTVLTLAGFGREGCESRAKARLLDPERASYTFDLAVCLEELEGGAKPVALLEELIGKGSAGRPWQRSKVLERLRSAYSRRDRPTTALAERLGALARQPSTPDGPGLLLDAAQLLADAGERAQAGTLLERFVGGNGTDPRWARGAMQWAQLEAERDRPDRAQQLWRSVIARQDLEPEWGVSAALALGDSLLAKGTSALAQASEEWDRCAIRHAGHAAGARCRLRRARAWTQAGRAADAQAELVRLFANPWRDVETTRAALSLLAAPGEVAKP